MRDPTSGVAGRVVALVALGVDGRTGRHVFRAVGSGARAGEDSGGGEHGEHAGGGHGQPALLPVLRAAVHVGEHLRRLGGRARVLERPADPVLEVVHQAPPRSWAASAASDSASSSRSFAIARLAWLLTVPGDTPSSWAVCASVRSS